MPALTHARSLCRSRLLALIWRVLTATACCVGLYPMFFGGYSNSKMLCYFTTQSNLLIAALFLVLTFGTALQLAREGARGDVFCIKPWLQLAIVFFIQITFLVFALLLAKTLFSMGDDIGFSNRLLHYIVPLMALADWILFMPHGLVSYKHAALWLLYPAAYVIFSFIRADLGRPFPGGSRFPYFFMDADKQGWNLLWICPLFFACFYALGSLIVTADRCLARAFSRKAPSGRSD